MALAMVPVVSMVNSEEPLVWVRVLVPRALVVWRVRVPRLRVVVPM